MYCGNDVFGKIERYKKFYNGFEPGKLLIKTIFHKEEGSELDFAVHSLGFTEYDLFTWEGTKNYFNRVIDWLLSDAAYHSDVDDDWIPELFVHLGTGVCGACFDEATLQFSSDTSWVHPSIIEWADMEKLDSQEDTFWSKRLKDITEYVKDRNRDNYLICPAMHFAPLDAANSLRGNNIFTDFYDEPEKVEQLLSYCTQFILRLQREFIKIVGDIDGGQAMWNMWIPGKSAIGLQEDTSNMCSSEIYNSFGRMYTREIISGCGGGFIHNHMSGKHQFELILSIKGLGMMNIANDPNCSRAIDVLESVFNYSNRYAPINFLCTPDEIFNNIEKLNKVHAILWVHCKNKDEAKRALKVVRDISCIK